MVRWLGAALVGTVLGALSGMGIGGGSLLLLWLTVIAGVPQEEARIINLMFFLPCAIAVSFFRWRQGTLSLKVTGIAVAAGCIGALLGNGWRQELDMQVLKKVLGVLFILCGLRELAYRPKKAK